MALIFLSACSTSTEKTIITPTASYSLTDVQSHATASGCWTTIENKVYDISSFFGKHKGWDDKLLLLCGKDGTALFEGKHGSNDKAKAMLATLLIGDLK